MLDVMKLAAVSAALAAALVLATESRPPASSSKGDRIMPRTEIEVDRGDASTRPGAHRPVRVIELTKGELRPLAVLAEAVPA